MRRSAHSSGTLYISKREGRTDLVRLSGLHFAAPISAAAILLSSCSSATQSGSAGLPATSIAPQVLGLSGRDHRNAHPAQLPDGRVLYVSDYAQNAVEILKHQNQSWTNLGAITAGILTPDDTWVDKVGNLYVSNSTFGGNVTEYDPSGNLIFTYSSGLVVPTGVTTDRLGNVYVVDGSGTVSEYPQGDNSAFSCSLPGESQFSESYGVAVDAGGDVFATLYYSNQIVEYPKGLSRSNCSAAVLPVTIKGADGIAIDRQGNLVVTQFDPGSPAIDIIAPPYTSVTATLGTAWVRPANVTIDKGGTQANVVDEYQEIPIPLSEVKIVNYPSGTTIATLGDAFGLADPQSAVDSRNYVP